MKNQPTKPHSELADAVQWPCAISALPPPSPHAQKKKRHHEQRARRTAIVPKSHERRSKNHGAKVLFKVPIGPPGQISNDTDLIPPITIQTKLPDKPRPSISGLGHLFFQSGQFNLADVDPMNGDEVVDFKRLLQSTRKKKAHGDIMVQELGNRALLQSNLSYPILPYPIPSTYIPSSSSSSSSSSPLSHSSRFSRPKKRHISRKLTPTQPAN